MDLFQEGNFTYSVSASKHEFRIRFPNVNITLQSLTMKIVDLSEQDLLRRVNLQEDLL